MPATTKVVDLTAGIPDSDEPGTRLVQLEPPSTDGTIVDQLPAVITDHRGTDPQLFALVDACDPERVHHYGIDVGAGAFTVRCDPASQTAFGKWISMRTAFERLDGLAGGPGSLALVVFDIVSIETDQNRMDILTSWRCPWGFSLSAHEKSCARMMRFAASRSTSSLMPQ